MEDMYCKLFIDTELSYDDIFAKLLVYLNGTSTHITTISSKLCEVCLKHNDYFSEKEYIANKNDFVYWHYYLEIYSIGSDTNTYVNCIKKLISFLKSFLQRCYCIL